LTIGARIASTFFQQSPSPASCIETLGGYSTNIARAREVYGSRIQRINA